MGLKSVVCKLERKCITLYMRLSLSLSLLSLLLYFNASNINYKGGADWLSLGSMSCNYLITGRARGTRERERRPPLLFSPHASSTYLLLPLPPPLPPQTKQNNNNNEKTGACYAGYGWPYCGTFIRGSKQGKRLAGTDQGKGR